MSSCQEHLVYAEGAVQIMNNILIGQVKSPGQGNPSHNDEVINNKSAEIPIKKECDPDERVLLEFGVVDLVFPNGKHQDGSDGGDSYENKLREFIHYQPLQLYMAPDIPEAIHLSSPEGKFMLKEALSTLYMESFYTVSPQIDNQAEYTCGSTSLVVALNSLCIDPARPTWYEEWRWHHLGSLACCTPRLQNPNMTLDQFSRLAVCNDTRAFPVTVTNDWTLDQLRSWVKMASSRSDVVMVLNYGRKEMKQAGSGHFLPLSGYHEHKDMFLLVDIAKHKYVPQWIPLHMLLGSLQTKDDRTGINRGFVLLMGPDYKAGKRLFGPSLSFRLDDVPGQTVNRLTSFMARWNRFLNTRVCVETTEQEVITRGVQYLLSAISDETMSTFSMLEMTLVHFQNDNDRCPSIVARCRRPQCPATCSNTTFCQQLESLEVFKKIHTCLESWTNDDRRRILDLVVVQLSNIDQAVRFAKTTSQDRSAIEKSALFFKEIYSKPVKTSEIVGSESLNEESNQFPSHQCPGYIELFPEHIATFVLLSWPYVYDNEYHLGQNAFFTMLSNYNLSPKEFNPDKSHTIGTEYHQCENLEKNISMKKYLNQILYDDLNKSDCHIVQDQVKALKRKLMLVLNYHNLFH